VIEVSKLKRFVFSLVTIAILLSGLILIDKAVGVAYPRIAPEFGRKNLALALSDPRKYAPTKRRTHIYLGYENTPQYERNGVRQHNNLGFRNQSDTEFKKAHDTIRILVLGGSTTYGTGVPEPRQAWPSKMQSYLQSELKNTSKAISVEVMNGGLPWGTTAELLNHYNFRGRYLDPDIVVVHSGCNDGQPMVFQGYNPEYTHWRKLASGGKNSLRRGEKELVEFSNIAKLLYAIWYNKIGYATPGVYVDTKRYADVLAADAMTNAVNNEPIGFSRNLGLLLKTINYDGAIPVYFHCYRPMEDLFRPDAGLALKKANHFMNYTELFSVNKIIAEKLEKAAKAVTKRLNVDHIAIESGQIPAAYFVDQLHLDEKGQALKAKFVGEHVLRVIQTNRHAEQSGAF
jgi:lysophospholipase L1-like esterase